VIVRLLAFRLARLAKNAEVDDTRRKRFVAALLKTSDRIAAAARRGKLRSYVDVSDETQALRQLAKSIARKNPTTITALVLAEQPDCRPALLAHAELLLDRGDAATAQPFIERALRIQAVCPTAQKLLARVRDGVDYDLRDKFCPMPFTHLSTGFAGDAFACCCPAWVPYPIGNVITAPSADAVWNSPAAQEIRRSIHDGDFRYCSRTLCSYIAAHKLPTKSEITDPPLRRFIDERSVVLDDLPAMVQLNHDRSCNLACPSCRTGIVTAGPEEQKTYVEAAHRVLLPLLRKVDGMAYISGGGEAFASSHYREILGALNRDEYPDLHLFLISNGQLLTEQRWREFPNLPPMIGNLSISIDAARAETYERLRRPGKWDVLMRNLDAMAEMRRAGIIRCLQINFVVQSENFRELPEFLALGERLGVDSIWLQRLTNYGAFSESVFVGADVTNPAHPHHAELLEILRRPEMHHPRVDVDMLMPLLPEIDSDFTRERLRRARRPEIWAK